MDSTPTRDALAAIAKRHAIRLILQFGSSVTGKTHRLSDIDLAVMTNGGIPSFAELGALTHDLQAAFPERAVDLALLNRADPLFLKKVMESARLLYGSPRELHELAIYAFKRYQDHRKYLDLERRFVAETLACG